jgi:hypothetical protein
MTATIAAEMGEVAQAAPTITSSLASAYVVRHHLHHHLAVATVTFRNEIAGLP